MICTFYSHQIGINKIIEILNSFPNINSFHNSLDNSIEFNIKGGIFSSSTSCRIIYRERKTPDYQISNNTDCPLNENLKGLFGFAQSLPTKNENVKSQFLHKIQTLNSEFSIELIDGKTKVLKEIIHKLSKELDCVLFVQPNTLISKSENQHFLDRDLKLIIDQNGNCEIDNLVVNINSEFYDKSQINVSDEQRKRKQNSENILKKYNVKINKNLPVIETEEETKIRSEKEIAERVTILAVTNAIAFNNMSGPEAVLYLIENNISELVTPKERDFTQNPTDEKKNQETWKCEGIWTLMWALNIVDELEFPNSMADLNKIPFEKYPIGKDKDPNEFINAQYSLRSKNEILNANDLYYRLDWACVDARINGNEITEVIGGVVYERHYALNWLINHFNEDWDDITCDT